MEKLRQLDYSHQMIGVIVLILIILSIVICLIGFILRQICTSRSISREEHNNVEYVMLQNIDDDDNNDDEIKTISTNGHTHSQTILSSNHLEKT